MITERCGDPEYWDKLDRNYETGINLGKLSRPSCGRCAGICR